METTHKQCFHVCHRTSHHGTWGTVVLVDEELVVARKGDDLRPAVAWHLIREFEKNWDVIMISYVIIDSQHPE